MPRILSDMIGKRAGRLVVKSFFGMVNKRSVWRCVCDCDPEGKNIALVKGADLQTAMKHERGGTRSCGCMRIPRQPKPIPEDRICRVWNTMTLDEVRIIDGLCTGQFHSQVCKTRKKHPECRSWRWTAKKLGGGKIEVRRVE